MARIPKYHVVITHTDKDRVSITWSGKVSRMIVQKILRLLDEKITK